MHRAKHRNAVAIYFMMCTLYLGTCALLCGCHAAPHRSPPFDIKEPSDLSSLDISPYPGAQRVKPDDEKLGRNVNVKLAGHEQLRNVYILSFQSPDSIDQVRTFYRADLGKRYGNVRECENIRPGTVQPVSSAPACQLGDGPDITIGRVEHDGITTKTFSAPPDFEIIAGPKENLHIVAIDAVSNRARFSVIVLDSHLM